MIGRWTRRSAGLLALCIGVAVVPLAALVQPAYAGFATVSFTQCANGDTGGSDCQWVNGILIPNNSEYFEGMSTPQRTLFTGIDATVGDAHVFTFDQDATKGGVHAYDFLTSYAQAEAAAATAGVAFPDLTSTPVACDDLGGAEGPICVATRGAFFIDVDLPDDSYLSKDGSTAARIAAYEAFYGNRTMRLWGDSPFTSASVTLVHSPVAPGADTASATMIDYTLNWTSASTNVLIEFAGHLSRSDAAPAGWGAGLGATSISGGPYHFGLGTLDGASIGNQDNQIASSAVGPLPATASAVLTKVSDTPGTFTFNLACVGFTLPGGTNPITLVVTTAGVGGRVSSTPITGIPTGTSCTATEVDHPDFTESAPVTVSIVSGTNTFAFTNTRNPIDLSIVKADSADPVLLGTPFNYTLLVTNIGSAATTGTITVTDTIPAGLTINSASGPGFSCGVVGQLVTCTRTTALPAGGVAGLITINVTPTTPGTKSNTGTVGTPGDSNQANDSDTETTLITFIDLSIVKADSADPVLLGTPFSYSLLVTNIGTAATTGTITVTDTVPAGLTINSVSASVASGFTCPAPVGQVVTCTRSAALAPGGPSAALITINVTPTTAGTKTNTGTVTTPGDTLSSNNSDTEDTLVTVLPVIDLSIVKNDSADPVLVGTPFNYTLLVTNLGNAATTGTITVTDTVPAGLTVNSASGTGFTCGVVGQLVTCTRNTSLPAGGVAGIITINVTPTTVGTKSNTGTVGTPGDVRPENNADTETTLVNDLVLPPPPPPPPPPLPPLPPLPPPPPAVGDLVIVKVTTGGTGTFTFVVDCTGTAFDQSVTITGSDSHRIPGIPQGTVCTVTEVPNDLFVSTGGGTVTIAAGDNAIGFTNTARTAGLRVTKEVSATSATVGDVLTYTFTVITTGNIAQTGAVVTDVVPAGLAFVAGSATCAAPCTSAYDAVTNTVTWTLGTVAAAATVGGLSFSAIVTEAAAGSLLRNTGVADTVQLPEVLSNQVDTAIPAVAGVRIDRPAPVPAPAPRPLPAVVLPVRTVLSVTGNRLPVAQAVSTALAMLVTGLAMMVLGASPRGRHAARRQVAQHRVG